MGERSAFPEELEFRYPWRPYQARVLAELEEHLDDDRLHVVAAPGAGKTVLGLEALRRLNAPTLILSPTITIRNQWLNRLEHLFLPRSGGGRTWISTDILDPKPVTSITYQALHSAVTGEVETEEEAEEEEDTSRSRGKTDGTDVSAVLERAGIKTVVLDECHHLRSEWWRALTRTIDDLPGVTVVALTATPPYDVPPQEWERYRELCGPIDAEISVPELVAEKNLCPHQDYVFLSAPSSEEKKQLKAFRAGVKAIVEEFAKDTALVSAIGSHPFLTRPEEHVREILDEVAYFSSIAIFLHHATDQPPKRLLKVMGLAGERFPKMTLEWWETLLTGCLFRDRETFVGHETTMERVERDLKRLGAVERRRVHLRSTRDIDRLLSTSLSKLDSITRVISLEHDALGDDLRLVILTDFIRAADMPRSSDDEGAVRRIGVVPIFEVLRRKGPRDIRLGILTGSLVVIPREALPVLQDCCGILGLDPHQVNCEALPHDGGFLRVTIAGADRKRMVRLLTETFSRGAITVLVGTKSLLGEGWDAPSVNSLVLASFVGSFMLSNQMRGRAIRVQPGNPDKTANIWHLVCVEDERGPSGEPQPGSDWETMTRRFKAFMGPSYVEPVIENGLERLGFGGPPFSERRIETVSQHTIECALDRDGMRAKWEEALSVGEGYRMVQELETPEVALPRPYVFVDAIKMMVCQGIAAGGLVLSRVQVRGGGIEEWGALFLLLVVVFGIGSLVALPFFLKALWLALRHGSVSGSLRQIGKALLRALAKVDAIETDINKMRVVTMKGEFETVVCRLEGGTTYEKSLFLDALEELLSPIENPRYLVVRKSRLGIFRRKDYHAVPTVLGRKKECARYFEKMWRRYVGPTALIYTRSTEGRRALLRARGHSLSATFLTRSQRKNRWR